MNTSVPESPPNGNCNGVNGEVRKESDDEPKKGNSVCDLPPTDDPELDALLDDALQDFDKPLPTVRKSTTVSKEAEIMMDSVWAEEFIQQATHQFEQKMRECLSSSLKPSSKKEQKQLEENMVKIVEAASTAALSTTTNPEALSSQLNEAIRNTAKKVAEKPSTPNFSGIPDDAEFARMMGSLGMGMDDENFDDSEMNEILPFMNNMMQKLLSKELLQPVLTDIVTKYPGWLSSNREKLSSKDYDKYSQQYDFMRQICEEYASEKDSDSSEVKKRRFDRISDLMLKVQYAGPPPQELVGEVDGASPLPGLDPAAGDQCSVM